MQTLQSPLEAEKWLLDHDFIELPYGSYFRWIEKKWFERYKNVLVLKNGAWIPSMKRMQELLLLDKEYRQYKDKNYLLDQQAKQLAIKEGFL